MGGEILFVEASKMAGDGELKLTGHLGKQTSVARCALYILFSFYWINAILLLMELGDVMRESAYLALTWLKSHADQVNRSLNQSSFNDNITHNFFYW